MDIRGKHVVITGAASGIGRALANRFVTEGAGRVVLADLDAGRVSAVATAIGAHDAMACNVADSDQVRALVESTIARGGPIDLFCANAGIGVGAGPETDDAIWDQIWHVNVMHHVYAARALLPGWLERGEGYFLSTASAAGLLTQLGSATYAVTKAGAVAFSEWLAITYGARGIKVSCLCPQGVNTAMISPDRPEGEGVNRIGAATVRAAGTILEPDAVADAVVEGLEAERFLILPHPEVAGFVERKARDRDRWIAGMQRFLAQVDGV